MHLTATQALNNTYGEIVAAGYLSFDGGGAKNNTAATLYRHHSFDGRWRTEGGTMATYTMPTISEVTGTVGGVIEGGQGVSISGHSFSNVDVTAGTVGTVRSGVNVLGSGTTAATGAASGAAASGTGNASGLKGIFGGAFANAASAAIAAAGSGNVGTVDGIQGKALTAARAPLPSTASLPGSRPVSKARLIEHQVLCSWYKRVTMRQVQYSRIRCTLILGAPGVMQYGHALQARQNGGN